jgi:hypothetical protein
LGSFARLGLLHHPDPSLSCNSFWGLSRRERCLDKPQKLLKKARIGVMQKDWITIGTAACSGITDWWLVTQRVGCPLQFVQRLPVAGAGFESPLSFVRQLPVVCLAQPPARDQSTRPRTQAAATNRTRWTSWSGQPTGCVTATRGYATARGIACGIQSFCITPILAFLNDF